jgi:preprotein translocase subunit SecG
VFAVLIVVHVIICLALMLVVLMQSSKGEGLAGAFGGGGLSGAVFGGRGAATFLSKATTILAILFMFSCIGLTLMSRGGSKTQQVGESAVERMATQQQQTAPPPQTTPTTTTTTTSESKPFPAAKDSGK